MTRLVEFTNKKVQIKGWVEARRDHGKLIFLVLRDRSGMVQAVAHAGNSEVFAKVEKLKEEYVISVSGTVKERPEKMCKDEQNGNIELEIEDVKVLSQAQVLPFEKDAELNIETHFDNLPLTLRKKEVKDTFRVQASLLKYFREYLNSQDFTEFQPPAIVGGDAEGGAGVFKLEYFKNKEAFLATSPQLYKQMMVGVFERVYSVSKVFRAEKHATSRHLSEYTSMDMEMGFIDSYMDVAKMIQETLKHMLDGIYKECEDVFEGKDKALVPGGDFPVMKLKEAQELIFQETGKDKRGEPDLEPEDERWLCAWSAENKSSDFIFITHYPVSKRPFYTYEDEEDAGYTKSFDLLFRGVEILSGGQRVHDYEKLMQQIKNKGLDPQKFEFYLQAFKYGIPPHGGMGMGLERLTAKIMGLKNIKEATLFPRDMTRIDTPLSE